VVRMKDHLDDIVESCKMLVDGIVNDFPNAVVEGRAIVRVAKVHSRTFANGFEAFENLDAICVVIFRHEIASI
jgi:hypothetical protein